MECREARTLLLDRRRGNLDRTSGEVVDAHLASCNDCRHVEAADVELSALLEGLPRHRAPSTLKRKLEAYLDAPPARKRLGAVLGLGALAGLAALALLLWVGRAADDTMLVEAVNDHLRVLFSEHPVEVESGGIHQVKPWFEGRLDFAPTMTFSGDDEFPLQGGSVAYFLDRKAATFVFKRRLHVITLFVFRSGGLPWPAATHPVGNVRGSQASSRGFRVFLWRSGDLGYALVSDVDARELDALAVKVASGM